MIARLVCGNFVSIKLCPPLWEQFVLSRIDISLWNN